MGGALTTRLMILAAGGAMMLRDSRQDAGQERNADKCCKDRLHRHLHGGGPSLAVDEAHLRREGAAVAAFYGQLTPGQQQTFYRETLPQNPRGGRGS